MRGLWRARLHHPGRFCLLVASAPQLLKHWKAARKKDRAKHKEQSEIFMFSVPKEILQRQQNHVFCIGKGAVRNFHGNDVCKKDRFSKTGSTF